LIRTRATVGGFAPLAGAATGSFEPSNIRIFSKARIDTTGSED
jgi:hypothetical protein